MSRLYDSSSVMWNAMSRILITWRTPIFMAMVNVWTMVKVVTFVLHFESFTPGFELGYPRGGRFRGQMLAGAS
eukprot:237434-Pleurochrysis_carterae.AAC.2